MPSFWTTLAQRTAHVREPFFVLAPMHEVTDIAFRQTIVHCGKPDVLYTEFVSCEGLLSDGRDRLMPDLRFEEQERPIVAQFFGTKPEQFQRCAALARKLGFDGIDINMGCPDRKVLKQGAGAALIKAPALAVELIAAAKDGAGSLPVSVKTRLGYAVPELDTWLRPLVDAKPAALVIHGRTVKELSKVPAHWDLIGAAAQMAHERGIVCVGNGDVMSREQGNELAQRYGVDGIMIGRGIFSDPWLFAKRTDKPTKQERLELLVRHTKLFEHFWPAGSRNFDTLKKFYKVYISGWRGSRELRMRLMDARTPEDVYGLVAGL